MGKSGTRNYVSISQGVRDLENNNSITCVSSCTNAFLDSLQEYRATLASSEADEDAAQLDEAFGKTVAKYQSEMLKHEKSLNKSIKQLAAKIDKSIDWELDMMYQYQNINDEFDLMVRAIVMDLLYQGRFEESRTLMAGPDADFDKLVDHFKALRDMMKAVYDEDYSVVLDWVLTKDSAIAKVSEIKSELVRLIYYQAIAIQADRSIAVPPHGNALLDAQKTDDSRILLRIKDYENKATFSPQTLYSWNLPTLENFDKEKAKDEVVSELIRVYNKLSPDVAHLQQESPLHKCLLAGHFALGVLVKYNTLSRRKSSSSLGTAGSATGPGSGSAVFDHISRRRSGSVSEMHPLISRIRELHTHSNVGAGGDSATVGEGADAAAKDGGSAACETDTFDHNSSGNNIDELPMEIELPSWIGYHTIFICPILKEETTVHNRPHVLPCRHFISKQALSKLAKGLSDEIKCPYCPRRGSWRGACEVKFIAI